MDANLVIIQSVVNLSIKDAVFRLFDALMVPERLKSVRSVFIKPNLVSDVPEYIAQGSNTDIRIIEAVLTYLAQYTGFTVYLGECDTGSRIKGRRLSNALEYMGVNALRKKYSFEIINMTLDPELRDYAVPNPQFVRSIKMSPTLMNAGLVINLPKLKTHKYATITCSLKNMFGTIPDPLRVMYHHDVHRVIADINQFFHHRMVIIVDGIVGMEGAGPIYGTPIPMNLVIGGNHPLAVDSVATRVMGFEPAKIKHLCYFSQAINTGWQDVRVAGEPIENVRRIFQPARRNLFVRIEGELMRHRWVVRLLFNEWFRRHITYHLNPILTRLRGGSYSWYIDKHKK